MLGSDYKGQNCSIARTLELVGERWTILILREVFLGRRRFEMIRRNLGLAPNVLTSRLERLLSDGILEKVAYSQRPLRYEYRLTQMGLDLWPVIVELLRFGDVHSPNPQGPPMLLRHKGCGGLLGDRRICERCGKPLEMTDVRAEPGPGAEPEPGRGARAKPEPTYSSSIPS